MIFQRALFFMLVLLVLSACKSDQTKPNSPILSPLETKGQVVFKTYCASCHATGGKTIVVGTSLAGIATRSADRIEGTDAHEYITSSILEPDAYTVEGFPEIGSLAPSGPLMLQT